MLRTICGLIQDAPHVVLTDGGKAFPVPAPGTAGDALVLPAQTMTVEYTATARLRADELALPRRLLLAQQGTLGRCLAAFPECAALIRLSDADLLDGRGVLLVWLAALPEAGWLPGAVAAFVPANWRRVGELDRFMPGATSIAVHDVPILPGLCLDLAAAVSLSRAADDAHRDLADEVGLLIRLCAAWQSGAIRDAPLAPGMRAIVTPDGNGFHIEATPCLVQPRKRAERRRAQRDLAQRQDASDIRRMPPEQLGAMVAYGASVMRRRSPHLFDADEAAGNRVRIRAACRNASLFDRGFTAMRAALG